MPGPQGEPGQSGVYVGSGDMPENCNVQIDPDGEIFDPDNYGKEILELSNESIDGIINYYPLTNKIYKLNIELDCTFSLPVPEDKDIDNTILIYTNITEDISIDWGLDVIFYNNEIPEVAIGNYEIIFGYEPILNKWCVGVISKGAVE
jgi:hypothetical protein